MNISARQMPGGASIARVSPSPSPPVAPLSPSSSPRLMKRKHPPIEEELPTTQPREGAIAAVADDLSSPPQRKRRPVYEERMSNKLWNFHLAEDDQRGGVDDGRRPRIEELVDW